jgi:hypothetical protein
LFLALALFALAAFGGYWITSRVGLDTLRLEAERQLSQLLGGKTRIESFHLRLQPELALHGTGVRVESDRRPDRVVLAARRVEVVLDTRSLLLGRFRADTLILEGLQVRMRRDHEKKWQPSYIGRSRKGTEAREERPELEAKLDLLNTLVGVAHYLLEEQRIARRIEIEDASVEFWDSGPERARQEPVSLRLEGANARLERGWLRSRAELSIEGTLVDARGRNTGVEIRGRREGEEDVELSIAATGFPIDSIRGYLGSARSQGELLGLVSGSVTIRSSDREHATFDLDWRLEDVEARIPLGDSRMVLKSPITTLTARIELQPKRVKLRDGLIRGRSLELSLDASAVRPLRRSSDARVRVQVRGIELDDLRRLAGGLPASDASFLLRLLDRTESCRVTRLSAHAATPLGVLGRLLAGELNALPDGVGLRAVVEDVTTGTSETDRLEDLAATVSWSGDVFELHGMTARLNGEALPRIDLAVVGVSSLLDAAARNEPITRQARVLPGLGALWDLIRGDDDPDPDAPPPPPIQVDLRELQHPALRWPVRNARIEIDPTRRDLHVSIPHAHWAGSVVEGEAVLSRDPQLELRIELRAVTAEDGNAQPDDPHAAPPGGEVHDSNQWAAGSFTSKGVHGGPIRFDTVQGSFALSGQMLRLDDVSATLERGGTLAGSASFSLATEGEVPTEVDLEVRDADADRVAQAFGLSEGVVSGVADLSVQLAGPLRPDSPLIGGLVGEIEIAARDGAVAQSVPLLAAIAHASEGFNPFTAAEQLVYEKIDARFQFEKGRIATDRFALEGPLRVLVSGTIGADQVPAVIEVTVGLFILRQADRLFGNIPLVGLLVPGSDRGLLGAYFKVTGELSNPQVRSMPIKSLTDALPLPEVLRMPFEALRSLFTPDPGKSGSQADDNRGSQDPENGEVQ